MHLTASPKSRSGLSPLALIFMLTALTLPLPFARADGAPSAPPDFPDTVHVENGCFISTLAFVAKFSAAFSGEHVQPVTVQPRNYDEPHTIALLTWQGHWWGRDEYAGIFKINVPAGDGTITETLRHMAEETLAQHTTLLAKRGRTAMAPATPRNLSVERRTRDVAAARALLPFPSEQFWVRCGGREIPFLFFRPDANRIAVYDPQNGTATAETARADTSRIVAQVAQVLGYDATSVRTGRTAITAVADRR